MLRVNFQSCSRLHFSGMGKLSVEGQGRERDMCLRIRISVRGVLRGRRERFLIVKILICFQF